MSFSPRSIAYFSMEVALNDSIPTYSGGLGVLAGDTLKSFADGEYPVVGVTMMYHRGYFQQKLSADGTQSESAQNINPSEHPRLKRLDQEVMIKIADETVRVAAWLYEVDSRVSEQTLPLLFLDTNVEGNSSAMKSLCDQLYGGDSEYRLQQEMVLGLGGVAMLSALGWQPNFHRQDGLHTYHMNEGHAAFLSLGLLREKLPHVDLSSVRQEDMQAVKERCCFTTHTPVPAGHDCFSVELIEKNMGAEMVSLFSQWELIEDQQLNMSRLAIAFSRFTNGVAKRHAEVSQAMFPQTQIHPITNGVHLETWLSPGFQTLFDQKIPEWRKDDRYLRYVQDCSVEEIEQVHSQNQQQLFEQLKLVGCADWNPEVFTIGFARRAATYKRADLIFYDSQRLSDMARKHGGLQIVFSGKAHPKDTAGKALIKKVITSAQQLNPENVKVFYVENYNMKWGQLLTAGVDLWLNNPLKPLEASGTSGMKAAANGVPSLSTLDGWWVEGCMEGVTGWEIEDDATSDVNTDQFEIRKAAESLYDKLDSTILPMFYQNSAEYSRIRRQSIAINGSFFSTGRMVAQYQEWAYS